MPKRTQKNTKKNKKTPNKKRPIKHRKTAKQQKRRKYYKQRGGDGEMQSQLPCNNQVISLNGNSEPHQLEQEERYRQIRLQQEREIRMRLLNIIAQCALQQDFSVIDHLNKQGIASYLQPSHPAHVDQTNLQLPPPPP